MNKLAIIILSFVAFIMNAACTYETENSYYDGDDMTTKLGWSQSGQIMPGSGNGQAVTMQAQFPVAGNYTVQFNLADSNRGAQLGVGGLSRARAEIIWSVAGNSARRVCDCASGVSVTGVAEAVSVRIYDDSVLGAGANPVPYVASVQVAKGTRPSTQQPPVYTLDLFEVVKPGTTGLIEVPQDIGAISVLSLIGGGFNSGSIDPLPPYSVACFMVASTKNLAFFDPRPHTWIPLVPGTLALAYLVSADAPSVFLNVTPILGIDG